MGCAILRGFERGKHRANLILLYASVAVGLIAQANERESAEVVRKIFLSLQQGAGSQGFDQERGVAAFGMTHAGTKLSRRVAVSGQRIYERLVRDVSAACQQIILRAHAHGIRVFGATITSYVGSDYYKPGR